MATVERIFLAAGGCAALLAVALGAFGAHALKGRLTPELLAVWRTAVEYHLFHALGLLVVGLVAGQFPQSTPLRWAGGLMLTGIIVFSGSLYVLALTGERWLGALTPLGGTAFLAAWALFIAGALKV